MVVVGYIVVLVFFIGGEAPDLAKRLKEEWLNFPARSKCEGHQTGGGNPFCSIRKCCQKKGIRSCAECEDFPCKKKLLNWISERYRKWNLKNLEVIKEVGYEAWLNEKEKEVKEGSKQVL